MKVDISAEDAKLLVNAQIRRENKQKQADNEKTQATLRSEPLPLPDNIYRTIVIDPPWPLTKIKRETRPNQVEFDYPTMTIDEIMSLNVPIADDGFVFLWTTQKYLYNSFDILANWGLTHRFTMVWHKNGGFQPYNSAQFNCEFVLVGSQGNPVFADTKAFKTAFHGDRRQHSVKPKEFYDILKRVTLPPRLDMFNRNRIDGFDGWGNETDDTEPEQQCLDILN